MFGEKDFLHVEGTKIKNASGQTVHLRGTNLGGWLMREGWLDGNGACRWPRPLAGLKNEEGSLMMDLGNITEWNRIHLKGDLHGNFEIKCSDDGIFWKNVFSGNFESQTPPLYPDGYAQPYIIGSDCYDHGSFYHKETLYLDCVRSRYIKITGNNISEAHISWYGDMDEFTARKTLEERFGDLKAEKLLSEYQKFYITEKDLDKIASLGFNFVRVPVYWQEIMKPDGSFKKNAWENLDWIIEACGKRRIYVMPDFHGAPGGNTAGSITCGQRGSNALWDHELYKEMSCRIIEVMAGRYGNRPAVAMYDLLNEPVAAASMEEAIDKDGSEDEFHPRIKEIYRRQILDMYDRLYQAARRVNKKQILSVQPFIDYDLLKSPGHYNWENVVYQTHTYGAGWRNHDKNMESMRRHLQSHRKYLDIYKTPILAGEFCFWGDMDVWEEWLKNLNRMGIHWTTWTYKVIETNKQDNWAVYYDFKGELPDPFRDSEDDLKKKYRAFSSDHYTENKEFSEMLSKYAKQQDESEHYYKGGITKCTKHSSGV